MASADVVLSAPEVAAAPQDYQVQPAAEIQPLAVTASFDGAGASGTFVPTLEVLAPSGQVVARCPTNVQVAAGGSADVSWFPRVGTSAPTPIGPQFSGDTIVPLAEIMGIRATQPAPANFGAFHYGYRVLIPKTGTLRDLAIYIGGATGNAEVAILSTTATTRTILYKSGLVALPTSHTWQVIGDPQLAVAVEEQYDVVCGFDVNPSANVMWIGGLVNSGSLDAESAILPAGFVPAPGGAKNTMTWVDLVSPVPYGAQTTVPEAQLDAQVGLPLVIGRIV